MKQDLRMVHSIPFTNFDAKMKTLQKPANLTEGANQAGTNVIALSGAGNVMVKQRTGAVTHTGSLAGRIEESADGSTGWATLYSFAAAGADAEETAVITTTKKFVRWVGTVTGDGAGTIQASASIVY